MNNCKEETDNCIRLERLIKAADGAVRITFDKYFPPSQLTTKIAGLKTNINQARFINGTQFKTLYLSGTVTSDDFDITLMVCLLRNYSTIPHPTNGYDMLPLASETGPGADLARIKYYRNMFAHLGKDRIPTADFIDYWNDLSQALIRLGGQDFEERCNALRHARLVTHCNCQDSHQIEITDWEKINEVFVRTSIVDKIIIHVQNHNHVITLIGASGTGKSAIIHHLALSIRDSDNCFIVPCRGPRDIYSHFEWNRKFVFVLDDICGRYTVIKHDVDEWIQYEEFIKNILKTGSIKILVSVRTQVFEEDYFQRLTVFKNLVFDLSSPEHCLSLQEKLKIANNYIPETVVPSIVDYIDKYHFFPLMCYIYKTRKVKDAVRFFSNPFDIYKYELDNLKNETDKTKYCSLFLLLVFDNHVEENCIVGTEYEGNSVVGSATQLKHLNGTEKCNLELDAILKTFGLNPNTTRENIIRHLDSMVNTYLVKAGTYYKAIHDKVFDFICFHFGISSLTTVLKYCSSKLISERTQLQSLGVEGFEYLILIPEKHESLYFTRIIHDILNGDVYNVMNNHQMKLQTYRSKLITFLKQKPSKDIEDILSSTAKIEAEDLEPVTPLYLASHLGYIDLVSFMLDYVSIHADMSCNPLTAASYAGHIDIVSTFLKLGADVNQRDNTGHTPLVWACIGRHKDVVQILIEKGANVNQRSRKGLTPLMWACSGENQEMVDLLVKHGADINDTDYSGQTSLMKSRKLGNRNILRYLIHEGADINQADKDTDTPLLIACRHGQSDVVKFLIEKGADINKATSFGTTPIMLACKGKQKEIVSLLIESHADVNIGDKFGRNALLHACENYCYPIFKQLLGKSDINKADKFGTTPLIEASFRGLKEAVELLIGFGASVNLYDTEEWTPLMSACDGAHVAIAALLIDNLADVNFKQNMTGITALFVACESVLRSTKDYMNANLSVSLNFKGRYGTVETLDLKCTKDKNIINLLITNNADVVEAVTCAALKNRTDIIQLLIDYGIDLFRFGRQLFSKRKNYTETNVEAVRYLIQSGCSVNAIDKDGMSPLSYACEAGDEQFVNLLINDGADINHYLSRVGTPLLIASTKNFSKITNMLLRHGALVNRQNSEGCTAFHVACANGFDEIVKLLLDYDCDMALPNNDGLSPLMAACVNKQKSIVDILVKYNDYLTRTITDSIKLSRMDVLDYLYNNGVDFTSAFLRKWKRKQVLDLLLFKYVNLEKCLNLTCELDDINLAERIINLGADVSTYGATLLLAACKRGSLKVVQLLVHNGANVNICQGNLCPLLYSYKYEHNDVSKFLISKGADIGQALLSAMQEKEFQLIRTLVDKGADINMYDQRGNSLLTVACSGNSSEAVSTLIEIGADVNKSDYNGFIPLVNACLSKNYETVRLLVDNGAEVEKAQVLETEQGNTNRETPLLAACRVGSLEIVKFLVHKGADVNYANIFLCPLIYSYKYRHYDVSDFLISKGADIGQAMLLACSTNNREFVSKLIEIGADVNKSDNNGFTPLLNACLSKNYETVRLLVDNGADVQKPPVLKNEQGNTYHLTPLLAACKVESLEIVELLVRYGADVNYSSCKLCPLLCSYKYGHYDVFYFLISNGVDLRQSLFWAIEEGDILLILKMVNEGANINMYDLNGSTPLTLECAINKCEVVEALIEMGADVNKSNEKGLTPLVTACLSGNYETVQILIENGADIENALVYASTTGNIVIIDILIEMGADINKRYKNGLTLLKLAQKSKQRETVEYLLSRGAIQPHKCCRLL